MMWGGEVVLRNGVSAGQVMSAAWGDSLGACVGLAYLRDRAGAVLTPEWVRAGGYEVDIAGERYPVTVSTRPPFDPGGERVRGVGS
jgi:4-methylaminobutanoate oxidase (formaldehyde-forming)